MKSLKELANSVHACEACPRLRKHCIKMAQIKRKSYQNEDYWGKPISGFGDPKARLLIVGLAPAAHGANRTGRIFTGDRSGDWLYRALHKFGFANQATSLNQDDGLKLNGTYISCVVKCAPPDNKPLPKELISCEHFLKDEIKLLTEVKVVLALGGIALRGVWPHLREGSQPLPKFCHGAVYPLSGERTLLLSYHPSQQNTFTGRLTEPMFDSVFKKARELVD